MHYTKDGSAMTEINDAAILKRAKELCAQDGVAWDWLGATAEGVRVLNAKDRRECLMRARDELITEAIAAGTWQYGKPVQSDRDAGSDPPPANPVNQVNRLKPTTNIEPTFRPKRRFA
jgi:hypothetical protein